MRLRSSSIVLTLSLSLSLCLPPMLLVGRTSSAQTASAPKSEAAQVKAARAKFHEGVRAYDRKDYEKARVAFLEAYRLHAHPALLLNIGQSALRTGRSLEAARYFRRFLGEGAPAGVDLRAAQEGLAEAEEALGRLEIQAGPGQDIFVDGEAGGATPLAEPLYVSPGAHQVRVGANEQRVTAVAGQVTTVAMRIAPPPTATTSGAPPATATAPVTRTSMLAPPEHMLPVYILGGVAVAGFAAAIVTAIGRGSALDNASTASARIDANGGSSSTCASTDAATVAKFGAVCSALATDNSQASTDATIRDIGLIAGGLALVGGVVYYFVAPKDRGARPAPPSASAVDIDVMPIVGRTTQGLGLIGSF